MNQFLFLFVAPDKEASKCRSKVEFSGIILHVAGSSTYEEAVDAAREYVAKGVSTIELCAGFGHKGAAMISEAVGSGVNVGVVRFDIHPGFGNKSGDAIGL
ncbi:MAG: hypothetical protein KAZ87_08360 [Spirochaetes bacterium]|nr:hypothetical protein [Spirochaetota bacterium]